MSIIILRENIDEVDEKMILLTIIGSLDTIKNGGITIDEAEKFLFSPHMAKKLREKECDEKIINLIMKGCELEDIVSLIPQKLNEVIEEMKQEALNYIKSYKEFNEQFWIEE